MQGAGDRSLKLLVLDIRHAPVPTGNHPFKSILVDDRAIGVGDDVKVTSVDGVTCRVLIIHRSCQHEILVLERDIRIVVWQMEPLFSGQSIVSCNLNACF